MNHHPLSIRLHGEPVDILEQTPTGKKTFTYNSKACMPISISMSTRKDYYDESSFEDRVCTRVYQ